MFDFKDFMDDVMESETNWEIDLSPLLALMVTLIPVLLLQTSFVSLKMLETNLPLISDKKLDENPKNKKKDTFEFNVFLKKNKNIEIKVKVNEKDVLNRNIASLNKENFDLNKFRSSIVEIKKKFPRESSVKITPDDKIEYSAIISFIDVLRKSKSGDSIKYKDATGQKVETSMLFPDVTFGNVNEK